MCLSRDLNLSTSYGDMDMSIYRTFYVVHNLFNKPLVFYVL